MAQLLKLFADPDRVNTGLHLHPGMLHVGEPLIDGLRCGSEAASIDHFSLLVQGAVTAPYVTNVDADRQLYLATLPRCFCDEVIRWIFHWNSLRPSYRGPAHPIYQE